MAAESNWIVDSLVALMWIAFEYVLWWRGSRIVIEAAGSSFSRNPHLAYFLHARWWDLVVLLLTVVGLSWSGGETSPRLGREKFRWLGNPILISVSPEP